jgi:hypothetical protein
MNDKLSLSELNLLRIINETCEGRCEVERDRLSVVARGKGLELGWSLRRLQALGLVREFRRQPNYFMRLFGLLPTDFVCLTEEGHATARKALLIECWKSPARKNLCRKVVS